MAIKVIKEELEARLDPLENTTFFSKPRAKIERKIYGNGNERLKLSISNFKVPDDEQVELVINDEVIAKIKIKKGRAMLDIKSENGDQVPSVAVNDTAEIHYKSDVFLKGRFYTD